MIVNIGDFAVLKKDSDIESLYTFGGVKYEILDIKHIYCNTRYKFMVPEEYNTRYKSMVPEEYEYRKILLLNENGTKYWYNATNFLYEKEHQKEEPKNESDEKPKWLIEAIKFIKEQLEEEGYDVYDIRLLEDFITHMGWKLEMEEKTVWDVSVKKIKK